MLETLLRDIDAADLNAFARTMTTPADFELTRAGRVTLVSGRRWKAARTGTEPLRALQAAMAASGAGAGLYVALGEPSDAATAYARENGIELLSGTALGMRLSRGGVRAA